MSSAPLVMSRILNIDHGLLGTCWPVLTETGGSELGGTPVSDGGPTGLVECDTGVAAVEVLVAGEEDVGGVEVPGEVDVAGGEVGGVVVTEPVTGTGEVDVAGGEVGGVTEPVTGTMHVEVGKKRPIACPLKCTSTWTKHLPAALAKSGTDSRVGPFGPIEKSALS